MLEIRESQIEDVLAQAPGLLQKLLALPSSPHLIARQMPVTSGRLDLLFTHQAELVLVELKAVPPSTAFVEQTRGYLHDLQTLQLQKKLLAGHIRAFLMCPSVVPTQISPSPDVVIQDYSPAEVLEWFAAHFRSNKLFERAAPIDYGIWNLHLIHELLDFLHNGKPLNLLQNDPKTIQNKVRFAEAIGLVQRNYKTPELTTLGHRYVGETENNNAARLSDGQIQLLLRHLAQSPFSSPVAGGITAFVESVFTLSHTVRPVPIALLTTYFVGHAGKTFTWKTKRAHYNGTSMYANYAFDLGLIAKSDAGYYLTPTGARFHLQAQLQKSIQLVETLELGT